MGNNKEEMKKEKKSFIDRIHAVFNSIGKPLSKLFKGIEKDLKAANIQITTQVYSSIIIFLVITSIAVAITTFAMSSILPSLRINPIIYSTILLFPILTITIGSIFPKIMAVIMSKRIKLNKNKGKKPHKTVELKIKKKKKIKVNKKNKVKKKKSSQINFRDFCYAYFNSIGDPLSKLFKDIGKDIEAANIQITTQVYLSIISFFVITATISMTAVLTIVTFLSGFTINPILYFIIPITPLLILLMGLIYPKMKASSRMSGLKTEIPYASMYISVMARGGLSPYNSLLRLRQMKLLPRLRDEIIRIQRIVLASGLDPVSAMEKAAKVVKMRDYKDLMLGYASTLRTGGDVLHYLYSQTELMFRKMASRIKGMGESLGSLLEAYIIVGILGALGIYMMFVISIALPAAGAALSPEMFFLFSFIGLPLLSGIFIYIGDTLQINYPVSSWSAYIALIGSIPLGIFLITQMVLPFIVPELNLVILPFLKDSVVSLQFLLDFNEGTEPAIGLAISLIAVAIPVFIVNRYYSNEESGILDGITSFFRDLVENRKTGLSPERCIQILSNRDYGRFSKYLKRISSQISWGLPIHTVFEDFRSKVRNWLAQVNIYLLVDTIAVGGGTEESLETLAEFSESIKLIDQERKGLLAPLIIVPYIGSLLLTSTTTMFITFFRDMTSISGQTIPYISLSRTLLTPLIFHSFIFGLVTGKLVQGKVSSGFKTAVLLVLVSLAGIWVTTHFTFFSIG